MTGDRFMPKMGLRQPGFTYSTCGPFTKHHESTEKKYKNRDNLKHLYRNESDEACFADDDAYSDGKDLANKNISDKVLKDRAYETVKNPKYDGNLRGLASMANKLS